MIRAGSLEEVMAQLQLRPEGEVPDLKEEMQQSQVPSHPAERRGEECSRQR